MWWSSASWEPPHTRASDLACSPVRSRRQAWAGVARPVGTCPRRPQFFFFLLIYPATPLRRAARHSRFHRSFLFSDPRIFYGQKKKMPHAPQIPSLVSHIFCKIRWQKRGLGEIFLIFAQGQVVTSPPRQIASLTWSHRGASFFPSPSYIL